jgi:hypothetical protein
VSEDLNIIRQIAAAILLQTNFLKSDHEMRYI